jgi:hypothetical protein
MMLTGTLKCSSSPISGMISSFSTLHTKSGSNAQELSQCNFLLRAYQATEYVALDNSDMLGHVPFDGVKMEATKTRT